MPDERESAELGPWARFSNVLVNFFSQLLSHLKDIHISLMLVRLSAEEKSVGKRHRNDIFKHPDIERSPLEPMTQHDQMHAFVSRCGHRWIDLSLQIWVLFDLKRVGYPILTFIFNIALFKYERSVPLHMLMSPIFLALFVHHNIELFNRLELGAVELQVHFDDLPGLFRYDIIELPGEIL